MESRTWQISEPNILTEDQFGRHWRNVIVTFVQADVSYRVASTRQHSEGFTVDDAAELDTQSETDMESGQE